MNATSLLPLISSQSAGREALRIVERLREAGFVAVLAGGCVRDCLLGRVPKDFDIATDAVPDAVRNLFGHRRTLSFGQSFGVIGVLPQRSDEHQTILPTEVATFRADGTYSDGRRPDSVTYGDAQADALRRDFTINGMFFDPIENQIIDHVGGLVDLPAERIRTIGDPFQRFDEDKLRLLRAVRFATTLNFQLEPGTREAILRSADEIRVVSGERIGAEMRRILATRCGKNGLSMLLDTGLFREIWPGLPQCFPEKWPTLFQRISTVTFEASLASILLSQDNAPESTESQLSELNHRWKLSGDEVRAVTLAIQYAPIIADCQSMPWSSLQPILINPDIQTVLATAQAIAGKTAGVERAISELERSEEHLDPPALLTGADLIAMGHRPGPAFKTWLGSLRCAQLDGVIEDRDAALAYIHDLAGQ